MLTNYVGKKGITAVGAMLVFAPLVGGSISAIISGDQMQAFGEMTKPALAPPGWLFPIAWTILYLLMGLALLYMIRSESKYKVGAICFFVSQLGMNYLWSPVFFGQQDYYMAFAILVAMWLTTVICAIISWFVDKRATFCLIPLILWTTFAGYLNASIAIMNT